VLQPGLIAIAGWLHLIKGNVAVNPGSTEIIVAFNPG
jgi:hypothetical protein